MNDEKKPKKDDILMYNIGEAHKTLTVSVEYRAFCNDENKTLYKGPDYDKARKKASQHTSGTWHSTTVSKV